MHENRLLTKCRLISTNKKIDYWLDVENSKKKIDYWLNVDWFRRTKKSIIDSFRRHENALCKFFIQFTKIRFVTSWFFQKTWIERQMNNIHRFQRKNFFINANSRSFSLIHDAHNENEMHSSFSKKEFQTGDFFLTRVSLRMMKTLFLFVFSTSNWRFSLIIRVFLRTYLTILFRLLAYFDEQFICRNRTFDRMSINFAKFKARNLLCKRQ